MDKIRILITSASSPTALGLARALSSNGHTVFGADADTEISPDMYLSAYTTFFGVDDNLWEDVLGKIESLDMIIPFGDEAKVLAEFLRSKRDSLGRVQEDIKLFHHSLFDCETGFQAFLHHEVYPSFEKKTTLAGMVTTPMTKDVESVWELADCLESRPSVYFKAELAPEDREGDPIVSRACIDGRYFPCEPSSLVVSKNSLTDADVNALQALQISKVKPYRITEVIEGGIVYEAHSMVNAGVIQTFVVTTPSTMSSKEDLVAVPSTDQLVEILYDFTSRFVACYQQYDFEKQTEDPFVGIDKQSLSMHLSLKFVVREHVKDIIVLSYFSTVPHASLLLLTSSTPEKQRQIALAYTDPASIEDDGIIMTDEVPLPSGV
ncbi:hypothetical protein K504DRAFT_454664 [Pleomassaria siparia CBS 279.74]|uniref:ATP-grasp domain-containing protein n=1 Tax=Pleomassaria siparia CBS 279.74 TaxID=1314801 RepID=A0A6G1KD12_9PLEO|nr:hypothetical protein K504DRAFT_454664 [Pleomassaria siparia CBS 279.74]